MADLITVSVASMLNTSRATAASAMLRVSQEENLRLRDNGEREYPFAQIGGGASASWGRKNCAACENLKLK